MKQRVPITSKSSNFKGKTQCYIVKVPKSTGAGQYCPKILRMPGTRGTRTNSSPALYHEILYFLKLKAKFQIRRLIYQRSFKIIKCYIYHSINSNLKRKGLMQMPCFPWSALDKRLLCRRAAYAAAIVVNAAHVTKN